MDQRTTARLANFLAIAAGALLLVWPALLNGFPIVFSDTHALLVQAGEPMMIWDKPWIYGPFLRALHANTTLWFPLAAQGLIVSHLLWLLQAQFCTATPWRHLALCTTLAVGSAAPWFTALLLPDMFAPVTVLGLYLIAFGDRQRGWLIALVAFAIAAHLSHLVIAAGCLAAVAALRWRRLAAAALPLAIALIVLVATNLVGYGRFAVSPYGAVFSLARFGSDGLLDPVLARACPGAGWHLCDWAGRLPTNSDEFMWSGTGPVWTAAGGAKGLAPEAGTIVARTIREEPLAVLRSAAANTVSQLGRVALGDALGPDWLDVTITGSFRAYFPPAELARFSAGLQARGRLAAWALPLNRPDAALLILGTIATLVLAVCAGPLRHLAVLVLVGLLANAFATGVLSGPHDRYQARIAWLVLLPPLLTALRWGRAPRPAPDSSAPASRSP